MVADRQGGERAETVARGRIERGRRQVAILEGGFRPFFLGAAVFVPVAMAGWIAVLRGWMQLPATFDPLSWHQHEMLFGYAAAVMAGFLLTAIPNWTGRLPLRGAPLGLLFGLWLAGRLAVAGSATIGPLAAMVIDVAFPVTMVTLVLREVIAGRNWRNLPVVLLVGLFGLANLLSHLEPVAGLGSGDPGHRLGIAVMIMLIGLIGGRVVPSFTANWLRKRAADALPVPFGGYDRIALLALAIALLAWTFAPDAAATAALLLFAGILHAVRLGRWRGWRTAAEPLVTILHVAYAWLPIGLVLLALERLTPGPWPLASVHALTAGAIGTMTLAIMTRASLGHSGRPLTAGPATRLIYAGVVGGAALRVLSPALPFEPGAVLMIAGGLWAGAFALFALAYGPDLIGSAAR